jgi:hypothetical protein
MKKSYFNPQTHVGNQPVRVLKWNILHQWENTHPDFWKEFNALLHKHGLKPFVKYDYTEAPIWDAKNPGNPLVPFVDANKEITIQETFLSFVWTICYSHLVFFEEGVNKPLLNQIHGHKHEIDRAALHDAGNLYRYGVSLIHSFSRWDKESLPNPEMYANSEFYVEKANGLFTFAVAFILCHELAHIDLDHIRDIYVGKFDQVLDETAADRQAVLTMLRGAIDSKMKFNYGAGMLLGFCSLLILKRELTDPTHPDIDERIERMLREQNLDDLSPLWGLATMSFRLWDDLHNAPTPRIRWPESGDTFKELFYMVLGQFKDFK